MANYYGGLITETIYPFGRGTLTSTGSQYSAVISSSATALAWTSVEAVSVPLPVNAMMKEVEYGLTCAISVVTTTAAPMIKWEVTDAGGSSYDSLYTAGSTDLLSVTTTASTDITFAGRNTPSDGTNFTGNGAGLDLVLSVACGSTTKAHASAKNSSYVRYSYYLVA